MKKLFTMIRQGKVDEVAAILDRKPGLIACTAAAPPKKDAGQSPLMVAIKSDNLEVAHLLLDRGAEVNFRDEPSQPYNETVPIWYLAVGQCFLRAGDTVSEKSKERSKGYFLLLRRLLDMGMDPNQRAASDRWSRNAWQMALDEYDRFAYESYSDYHEEGDKAHNRQLREMLKAVLDLLRPTERISTPLTRPGRTACRSPRRFCGTWRRAGSSLMVFTDWIPRS